MAKKKILLLGDSIRIDYQDIVLDKLGDRYEVIYPDDNGKDVSTTLWQANQFFKIHGDFDLIHWNNGYWDMNIEWPMEEAFHPLEEYEAFLNRMCKFFRQHSSYVIFAATLPVRTSGYSSDNKGLEGLINYDNSWVEQYNEVAKITVNNHGVVFNDLYSVCLEDGNYYKSDDGLHLTMNGNCIMADAIVELIEVTLNN